MSKCDLFITSTILAFVSSHAWAETPIFEIHGSFGGARADAASISADGKTIGVRRMDANGAYDKSFIVNQQGITDIGSLSSANSTALLSISANGLAAIGISAVNATDSHAFWWTRETGIRDLGTLGGTASYANGLSADGNVVAGDSYTAGNTTINAFRWTLQDGMTSLGTLGGLSSYSHAVSADGSTIVGYSTTDTYETKAFRWTQATGMVSLRTLGGLNSTARGVSSDGSVAVGASDTVDNQQHAFRWTADTGMVDINPQGSAQHSIADLVSGDGKVVVGSLTPSGGFNQAFRWTAETGMISLGSLGGGISHALSMTDDGSAVVGYSYIDNVALRAFRWTANDGMVDLGTIGGNNAIAWDVSADGTVVAGTAETADGALHATLWKFPKPAIEPEPNNDPDDPDPTHHNPDPQPEPQPETNTPLAIDLDNTAQGIVTLASDSFSAMEAQRLTLNKLQNFCDVERAGQTCYSLFTDISGFGGQKDLLTGFTLGHGFTDNFSAGVTLAHSFWRDQPDGVDTGSDNFGGGIFAQWKDKTAIGDWYMRASLAANRYNTDITRPMLAYTEAGTGESRLQGWSTALELGRTDNLNFHNARLGYYGGLRYSNLSMDGYTESNALFPFTYDDMKYELTTAYAGANFAMPLTDRIRWSINLEIEQDVAHKDPEFDARADYIGVLTLDSDFSHTRGSAWTSVSYAVSDAVELSLTPYVTRTASRDNAFGAMVRLSGKF
ncbi:autotransporter domain-containing protein [Brucella pituitosa]|uniref:autotransporter domain-containing protein n=1 Tax=Brucella pituitosa TaxID=571256 RepID=UPI0009A15DCB|nr:autotransporter domain-containing protein [Brucella pituitosa]